jgi:redox-sensitive bicupin YhaK (pirin superfamily)
MTAGSGLLHNEFMTERFSLHGGIQHAVQLWVNLPKKDKMTKPRYQALTKDKIPESSFSGGRARVIAGSLRLKDALGTDLEVNGVAETFSPIELYDIRLESSSSLRLDFEEGTNVMLLVVDGSGKS